MVRGEREVRQLLAAAGLRIVESWRTPHLRFRCVNQHGIEVSYTGGCTVSDVRALHNARSTIRKLSRLTAPQGGSRL